MTPKCFPLVVALSVIISSSSDASVCHRPLLLQPFVGGDSITDRAALSALRLQHYYMPSATTQALIDSFASLPFVTFSSSRRRHSGEQHQRPWRWWRQWRRRRSERGRGGQRGGGGEAALLEIGVQRERVRVGAAREREGDSQPQVGNCAPIIPILYGNIRRF